MNSAFWQGTAGFDYQINIWINCDSGQLKDHASSRCPQKALARIVKGKIQKASFADIIRYYTENIYS